MVPDSFQVDVEDLMADGAKALVLSVGFHGKLHVSDAAIEHMIAARVPFFVAPTAQAVELFNRFSREGIAVGGLLHSTTC